MRQVAKLACARIAGSSLARHCVGRLERRETLPAFELRVLTYHRIGSPERDDAGDPKLFSATPDAFAEQLDVLAEHYCVVSIEEVLAAAGDRRLLPPRAVLITFDDAYADFQELAWPMLQERQLPVVLFVPTAYPDRQEAGFWWDRLARAIREADFGTVIAEPCGRMVLSTPRRRQRASQRLRAFVKSLPHDEAMACVDRICEQLLRASAAAPGSPPRSRQGANEPATLGWDALRRLHAEGVAIGAHTRTHPLLNRIGRERLEEEVYGAKADLERELGSCLPVFAYPAGAVDSEAVRVVRAAGFRVGLTTRPGLNRLDTDEPFRLRRYHVGIATTASLLRTRLALR
ncbi:polysaccharide deacetylase family protein [Candidatus Laterigemmans baculatus]|uniref:polysaccharide deacetylase family protein n=1 Tax=Candidatus Laterigemmans baculatus TaxID=2770505 RepID=UPI0013D959F4|nr:polysaccharide deacetylase family protein [Candidatus Laterigemmans baculatus]